MFLQLKSFISLNPLLFLFNSKIDLFSLHPYFFLFLVKPPRAPIPPLDTNTDCSLSPIEIVPSVFPLGVFLHISMRLQQNRYGPNVAARLEKVRRSNQTRTTQDKKGRGATFSGGYCANLWATSTNTSVDKSTHSRPGDFSGCIVDCILNVTDAQL